MLCVCSFYPFLMDSPRPSLIELQKKRKTRFPLSRIKKVMQQDEEVGKTAVTVPVVLSRGLELFFEQIILKLTQFADKRGSKRVLECDFKELVESNEKVYGFLKPVFKIDTEE